MIAIIDYKAGNALSVLHAVNHLGYSAKLVKKPKEIAEATQVQWHDIKETLRLITNQRVDVFPNTRDQRDIAMLKFIQKRDVAILNKAISVLESI